MYAAGAELSEDLRDLGQASWALSDILEVESPKAQDQELYQSLAEAARSCDLEKLLSISDAHLTELSCINAAFALIRAARMVEAERKQDKEPKEKPLNPKLLNLLRHVESIVIAAHRRRGFESAAEADLEDDSSSDESKVEDQGLHMAWTLSSISWALGLLGYRNEEFLLCLASLVKPHFPHFSPHQLQNCLWAFASLGMKDSGPFFGAAVEAIEPRIRDFSNESLVAILTSFAKVKVFSPNLFDAAAEVLAKEGSLVRPQDIANCTWAFATSGHAHPEIFAGLSSFAVQRLHEFQPEQVALLVWAFSFVRCRSDELFEAVTNTVAERYRQFSPDSLANVLQAFALVGHRGSLLILEDTADYILGNLAAYTPKALSKVVFTISQTRGYVNLTLNNALADAFLETMDAMTASLLTATLMAFSKVEIDDSAKFFQQAAEKVAPVLSDFDSSGFVRLAKVFAQAGAIDQGFSQEITEEAMERIPTLRAFELVILTKALLGMCQASPHLLESLAEHGSSVLPQMSQKELASFIRSLSGMGLTSASSTGEAIFKQAAVKATRHLMTRKEDRRSKTSDLACLSRAFARAACATGPVADKFQAAGSEPPSELLEVIRNFLKAAVKEAHARLDEFRASPSCLVGVLWAASQCGVPCDTLTQVAKAVLLPPDAGGSDTHLQRLQLPELAELAQALTSLGVEVPELYRAISDKAIQCLQENDGAKVVSAEEQLVPASELLRSLATAGLLASALARTTSDKVNQKLAEADGGKVKIPAWVIARCIAGLAIAVPVEQVISALKALASAAAARVVELFPEERALIFWSLSLHGCYEAIFDSVLEQTPWTFWAAKPKDEFFVGENGIVPSGKLMALCQVHLADLALQLEGGRNRKGLSPQQRQHVLEAATLMQRVKKEVFGEADAIAQALRRMDLVASVGHSSPEGIPLGISVSSPNSRQSRVTIQVDQPGDFLLDIDSSCAHRFPPTTLRRRLLWRLGYTVVVLPWYEVNCCDPDQLQALLRARLGAVSPPSPSFLSAKGVPRSAQKHGLQDVQIATPQTEGGRQLGELPQVLAADTGGSGDSQSSQESSSAHGSDFEPGPPARTSQNREGTRPPGL